MAIIKEVFGASSGQLDERRHFRLNVDEIKRLEDASGVSFDTPDRAVLSRLYWDIEKSVRPAEINPKLSPADRKAIKRLRKHICELKKTISGLRDSEGGRVALGKLDPYPFRGIFPGSIAVISRQIDALLSASLHGKPGQRRAASDLFHLKKLRTLFRRAKRRMRPASRQHANFERLVDEFRDISPTFGNRFPSAAAAIKALQKAARIVETGPVQAVRMPTLHGSDNGESCRGG